MIDNAIPRVMAAALFVTATPCGAFEPVPTMPIAPAMSAPSPASASLPPQKQSPAVSAESERTSSASLSDDELGTLRGGDGSTTVITNQTLSAVTSGNVINGNYSAGNINVSDSALSNFNGLGNIIINTGAQVSLQSGMSVTINTTP